MNPRIKELAEQVGLSIDKYGLAWDKDDPRENGVDLERFAELIRQDEREACANVADEFDDDVGQAISRAIRARGEK